LFCLLFGILFQCKISKKEKFDDTTAILLLGLAIQNCTFTQARPSVPSINADIHKIILTPYGQAELPLEDMGDHYLHLDIMFTKDSALELNHNINTKDLSKSVYYNKLSKWTNNTMPYEIDPNLYIDRCRIKAAVDHVNKYTNLKMIPRNGESNYVYFTNKSGNQNVCTSYVGMIGSKQNIALGTACNTGSILHEIGHAAGLFHEQGRLDRDTYVNILTENIEDGYASAFNIYTEYGINFGAYDFNSIMHYDGYSFSKNAKPTITKKSDGSAVDSQRTGFSTGDISVINFLYP